MGVYLCIYCIGSLLSYIYPHTHTVYVYVNVWESTCASVHWESTLIFECIGTSTIETSTGGAPHQEVQLEASHYVAALFNDLLFPAARLSTAHPFPPLDLDAAIPHAQRGKGEDRR